MLEQAVENGAYAASLCTQFNLVTNSDKFWL
jgi:hypothetical protein